MQVPVLQRHNLWVLILLKTQRNFKLEDMFSMDILIMMPVVKLLQKHSWAKLSSFAQSENYSNRNRHDFKVDFRLEWRPDTLTTIIFRPNGSYSQTESSNSSWSKTENNLHSPVNEKEAASSSKSHNASLMVL